MTNTRHPKKTTEDCVHHWIIDPANGPVSEGRCKKCGARKDFFNAFEGTAWGVDKFLPQAQLFERELTNFQEEIL